MLGKFFHRESKATPAATPQPSPQPPAAAATTMIGTIPSAVSAPGALAPAASDAVLPVPEHPAETVRFQARHAVSIAPNKMVLAATLADARAWTNPLPAANPRRRAITKSSAEAKPSPLGGGDAAEGLAELEGPATTIEGEL